MVIGLIKSEKSALFGFLGLYLGSSFLLMLLVSTYYYQREISFYFEFSKLNMRNKASLISKKIINAHMQKKDFKDLSFLIDEKYKTPSTTSAFSADGVILAPIIVGKINIKNIIVPIDFTIPFLLFKILFLNLICMLFLLQKNPS